MVISIMEIEELINSINETSKEYTRQLEIQNNSSNSNIFFFSNDMVSPTIDFSSFNSDERKIISNMLRDIAGGILGNSNVVRKVMMDSNPPFNVYAYKKQKTGLTFIKVGKDKLLILCIGNIKNLFNETINLVNRDKKEIEKQIKFIESGEKEYIENQSKILSTMEEEISSGRKI